MNDLPFNSLPEWFEHQVRATPDESPWSLRRRKKITYAELNRRANRLARRLEKLGVGPEKIVAVCLERSLDLIAGLLGILKAGGAYLPIDRDLPQERQAMMRSRTRSRSSLLIYTQQIASARKFSRRLDARADLVVIDAERRRASTIPKIPTPITAPAPPHGR